jgi:hypothetical protein
MFETMLKTMVRLVLTKNGMISTNLGPEIPPQLRNALATGSYQMKRQWQQMSTETLEHGHGIDCVTVEEGQ